MPMKPPTLREKTKRGLLWASAEAVARTLLQTVVLVVLSRLLTPDDYGVVGAALIIVGISSIFSQLGVGPAIVQRSDLEPRHLDAAFALSVVFGLLTAAIIYASAGAFALFFKMDALAPALRALAIIFPITSLGVVSESLLQRDLRFDLLARAEVVSYFIGYGGVAIALAWFGWGTWSLVAGQVAQMIVRTAMLFGFHEWRPRLACERGAMRDLRRFSSGMTVARLANYVATNGDNVIVGRYLGASALGVYGRAYQLMSQPANLVGNVLEKVLFPAMAKVQDRDDRLAAVYRQGVRLLATVMLPGSAMIYLLAPELVQVLLGSKWAGVIFPLQIFSVALLFRTSMKMSNSLIRAKGAICQMVWCQIVYAAATVGFAYAGRSWGIEGVCVGVLGSILLCFLIGASMSLRLVKLTWLEFLADHLPGLLLTAVVSAAGWLGSSALRSRQAPPLLVLAGTLAAMLAIALVGAVAFPKLFLGPEGPHLVARLRAFFPALNAKSAAPRLAELDVLRGFAACAVMVFHYTVRYGEVFAPGGPPAHPSSLGNVAVHLFFMISGFVIFMTLSKTRTALDFLISRFSRLYPVYWVAVLVTFALLTLAPLPNGAPRLGELLGNLTMLQFWLRIQAVDGVYWTLAVELSFYAIMLAVFLGGWLGRIEWLIIPWLVLEIAWACASRRYDLPKIIEVSLLLKYAHLFLAGILFYRLRFEGSTPARHALLACCFAAHAALNGSVAALFAAGFFAAFYALACDRLAWIAARPLVFLGAISYSLYLVHQNIGYLVMRALGTFPRPLQISAAIAVALLLASLLTFFIERPALRAIRVRYKARRQPGPADSSPRIHSKAPPQPGFSSLQP
jgi:O-antigen/teichoic acid export membrane protein/peptidoglycan/LPS O-acetylase OafA/YrhL